MNRNSNGAYPIPIVIGDRRMVLLAEGSFSPMDAKTAVCLIRYMPDEVSAVIDSTRAPADVRNVLGFGEGIPIVASLEDALTYNPNMLVVGTAPRGGMLSPADREVIVEAVRNGLHVASGMHIFLGDDAELAALAAEKRVVLWDVRKPPGGLDVSSGGECPHCPVILTVGSDCNTGKMTAAMEMKRGLEESGLRAGFAATGQTGMMITGRGIAIDSVVADFIGGATERLILETAPGMDVVILEGQGSLLHPGYAGVTVGMISGGLPGGMILCHQPTRTRIHDYTVPIPPLPELVRIYENAITGIKRIPVIGIALNTYDMDEGSARRAVATACEETGLPVTDPVRFGAGELVEAVTNILP